MLALPTLGNAEQYALTFYNFLASDQLQKEFVRKKALDFNQLGLLNKTIPDGEMKTLQSLLGDVKETGSHEDFEKYALAIYKVTNKFLYPDGVAEYVMSDQVSYHNVFSFSWFGFFDAEKNESGLTKYQVEKVEKHQKYCEDLKRRLKEAHITNVDPT